MTDALLGIDIGTSSCKLTAFTIDGKVIISVSEKYPTYYPAEGWVEQKPEEWWHAVCEATKKIVSNKKMVDVTIQGIGVDGQGWSMIPIDCNGKVIFNNPIWMDTRATDLCNRVKEEIGEEKIFEVSGNPFQPTYSLPKLLWLKENHQEIFKRVYKVLQSNSYIVYKLTGKITQDISQGYGLHCFDMKKGEWSEEMCDAFGIPSTIFPSIYNSDEVVGHVSSKASAETWMAEGIPVVAGGVDAACGALGTGVISNGETQEQGGQAEGMSICLNKYIADPRLIMGYHVVPGHWLLQGGTVGGGGVIDWVKNNFCFEEKSNAHYHGTSTYYEMDQLSARVPAGSEGVIFLPYMKGERSPIWNPYAKGVYYGLDFTKTRSNIIRASQEGIAYSLRHNLVIAEQLGAKVKELWAMGGSANSTILTQIKADVTEKIIRVPSSDTATTLGAAILAGVGVHVYKDYEEARAKTVRIQKVYKPNKNNLETYNKGFAKYLKLYESLKGLMK
ncbi:MULTISPECIES: xylulokinase [unclassified Lactobacillus]|uniref:xylulokinase n=1 Tax=unclassified Lactobacillus TaxID=2620435 RepID=UPI0018DD47D7|nr:MULTISPECIES: FGGY-family carbohydrate kinase [unclassified Lactobacillus]MBH9989465.1 FGGY-family carbohydrate kinase [Lactobacillus sp. M0392]MBI0023168.1 FGGY-family carbohydrate kinase [Lactobacillus sp. W8171]MBI0044712.1 FGGY-family carbohydrate kinase [Lactobacillus sp. M0393]MCT6847415.1 FGGY-family carbohydrate kinase [Lactobacillus helsingborgensis]